MNPSKYILGYKHQQEITQINQYSKLEEIDELTMNFENQQALLENIIAFPEKYNMGNLLFNETPLLSAIANNETNGAFIIGYEHGGFKSVPVLYNSDQNFMNQFRYLFSVLKYNPQYLKAVLFSSYNIPIIEKRKSIEDSKNILLAELSKPNPDLKSIKYLEFHINEVKRMVYSPVNSITGKETDNYQAFRTGYINTKEFIKKYNLDSQIEKDLVERKTPKR